MKWEKQDLPNIPIGETIEAGDVLIRKFQKDGVTMVSKESEEAAREWLAIKALSLDTRDFEHFGIPKYSFEQLSKNRGVLTMPFYAYNLGTKQVSALTPLQLPHNFEQYIPRLVSACLELMSISRNETDLPMDEVYRNKTYAQRAQDWSDYIARILRDRHDIVDMIRTKLITASNETNELERYALSHGNFWQDHLALDVNDTIVIFDFGTISFQRPKYYDVLFFIHRLYTAMESPSCAIKMWEELLRQLPAGSIAELKHYARCIFAQRAIGGIFDYCVEFDTNEAGYSRLNLELAVEFSHEYDTIFSL